MGDAELVGKNGEERSNRKAAEMVVSGMLAWLSGGERLTYDCFPESRTRKGDTLVHLEGQELAATLTLGRLVNYGQLVLDPRLRLDFGSHVVQPIKASGIPERSIHLIFHRLDPNNETSVPVLFQIRYVEPPKG